MPKTASTAAPPALDGTSASAIEAVSYLGNELLRAIADGDRFRSRELSSAIRALSPALSALKAHANIKELEQTLATLELKLADLSKR